MIRVVALDVDGTLVKAGDLSTLRARCFDLAEGNAHADLERAANRACGPNDRDGLAEVVDSILEGR